MYKNVPFVVMDFISVQQDMNACKGEIYQFWKYWRRIRRAAAYSKIHSP